MAEKIVESVPNTNILKIGFITTIFLIVASVLSFAWIILEDRISRKKLLICATACWVSAMFLVYFSNSYFELFLFHMIAAVGYAAIFPVGFSITMDYIVPEERARAFSFLGIAGIIGIGLSYILGGILSTIDWHLPFLVLSVLGCVVIVFLFTIEDPKKGSQEKELMNLFASGVAYSYRIKREDLGKLVKNKANLCLIAYSFLLFFARGGISYFIITMIAEDYLGGAYTASTLLVIGTYGTMIAGNIFWGKRADKKFAVRPDGKVRVLLEALLLGPGFLVVAYSMQFSVAQIGLIILFAILVAFGAFITSALTSIGNSIIGDVNPPELRATAFSLNNFAQTIGRSLSISLMTGFYFLFGETYHWGFAIMVSLVFGGIVLMYPLKKFVPKELTKLSKILTERAKKLESELTD